MTATQSGPHHRRELAPGTPPVAGLPRRPGRVDPAGGRAALGRPDRVLQHDVPLTFTELGRPRARRRRLAAPTTASAGATSSRCTCPTAGSTRRSTTGPAGRGHLLPHQPAAARPRPRRPAHRRRRHASLITWDQVLPFVRGALAATPVETVIVTGEAHTHDFAARLELEDGDVDLADLLAGDPTDRHLDADVDAGDRPRPPGLHRRDDRREQGRGAAAPQRRHQRAAVGVLDLGVAARARRGRRRDAPPGARPRRVPDPARRGPDRST